MNFGEKQKQLLMWFPAITLTILVYKVMEEARWRADVSILELLFLFIRIIGK
jgi:hypothetical protein